MARPDLLLATSPISGYADKHKRPVHPAQRGLLCSGKVNSADILYLVVELIARTRNAARFPLLLFLLTPREVPPCVDPCAPLKSACGRSVPLATGQHARLYATTIGAKPAVGALVNNIPTLASRLKGLSITNVASSQSYDLNRGARSGARRCGLQAAPEEVREGRRARFSPPPSPAPPGRGEVDGEAVA